MANKHIKMCLTSLILACLVTQSYPTLCDPMDRIPPGSSIHGILQARILEWVAMPSFMGSSQPRDQTQGSLMFPTLAGRFLPLVPSGKPQGNANQDHNKRWFCPNRMTLKKKKNTAAEEELELWHIACEYKHTNTNKCILYIHTCVYTHTHANEWFSHCFLCVYIQIKTYLYMYTLFSR